MALRAIALNAPIGSQGNQRLFFPKIRANSGILRVFAGSPFFKQNFTHEDGILIWLCHKNQYINRTNIVHCFL
jgi:hypothetical protein